LSGNLVLQVTPHTSLQLHGRTAELLYRNLTDESYVMHGILPGTAALVFI
jgi:hypothetical protein